MRRRKEESRVPTVNKRRDRGSISKERIVPKAEAVWYTQQQTRDKTKRGSLPGSRQGDNPNPSPHEYHTTQSYEYVLHATFTPHVDQCMNLIHTSSIIRTAVAVSPSAPVLHKDPSPNHSLKFSLVAGSHVCSTQGKTSSALPEPTEVRFADQFTA